MIDPKHPTIQMLATQGYEISAHAYFKNGLLRFTYAARHSNGTTLQGWSQGGSPAAALADLAKRAGIAAQNAVHAIGRGAADGLPENGRETTRNRMGGAVGMESRGHVNNSFTKP